MEFLKEILGDKYGEFEQAINDYNGKPENKDKQIKLANLTSGEYVGIGKYNALVTEKDGIQEKLTTAEGTIETLKKDNKGNEELQKTIKAHEVTIETLKTTYEGKIKDMKIDAAIKDKLGDAKHPEFFVPMVDRKKLTVSEDGTVLGIDDQVKVLKETYKDQFTVGVRGNEPYNKEKNPNGIKNPWSKEHFNLTEQGKLWKENPELARQFMASK